MAPPRVPETISVVMPVHNALPHLDAAVRSILEQTHSDFEFVIFDDGSTDGSTDRLRDWAKRDRRIRLVESRKNLGPAASSNQVVACASGSLIARMDADDISHPRRLERELSLLRKRPDVALVGTLCDIIGPDGSRIRSPDIWRLTRNSWFAPFPHGSIFYRREVFDRVGGYREECEFWEDQDFFLRVLALPDGKIVTVPEPLYSHRHSSRSTRLGSNRDRVEGSVDRMYRSVDRLNDHRSYEDLLSREDEGTATRLDPRVFIALGSLELWAGRRPRLFRRLLNRAQLSLDFRSLSAIAWTSWASASPSTLRPFMKVLAKLRNLLSRGREMDGAVEWAPPYKPHAIGPARPAEPRARQAVHS